MDKIVTVNAIILNERNELLVVKENEHFLLPGGKMKPGETDLDTLGREIREETKTRVINAFYFKTFSFDKALQEPLPLEMRIYIVKISGTPVPNREISELLWLNEEIYKQEDYFPKAWWNPIFAQLKKDQFLQFDGS